MDKNKNVLLPLSLLKLIIKLLERLDVSNYNYETRWDYSCALLELKIKIHKLELREAYTEMIKASDQDAKKEARMKYHQKCIQFYDIDENKIVF